MYVFFDYHHYIENKHFSSKLLAFFKTFWRTASSSLIWKMFPFEKCMKNIFERHWKSVDTSLFLFKTLVNQENCSDTYIYILRITRSWGSKDTHRFIFSGQRIAYLGNSFFHSFFLQISIMILHF